MTPMPDAGPFGFTHHRPDGNRRLDGAGSLPTSSTVRELGFDPAWIVGLPDGRAVDLAVVGADGAAAGLRFADGTLSDFDVRPGSLSAGVPPLLAPGQRLVPPPEAGSTRSHPFPLGDGRALIVGATGDLLLWDDGIVDRLPLDVLPDARVVRATEDTYAVFGGATDRYAHGALGDEIEAGLLAVVEAGDGLTERARATFDGPVAEGLLPIVTDFGRDQPLVVVTLTDEADGARVVAFELDGQRAAVGPGIGTGFRWRHQLAVAPFGPNHELELAAVKTPHIGGVAEFYRLRGDRLELVAERAGYSTHAFGSRNLDGAMAGDLDGDGRTELLVPTQSRETLAALRRTAGGVSEAWRLELGGDLSTNLAGVTTSEGAALVAAGTADGRLHVWA